MKVAIITGTRETVGTEGAAKIGAAVEWADRVIVGDCPTGVDSWTRSLCESLSIPREVFEADWDRHGKSAGPRRNGAMVRRAVELTWTSGHCDLCCFAFPRPSSKGTWDCLKQAADAGIRGRVVPL